MLIGELDHTRDQARDVFDVMRPGSSGAEAVKEVQVPVLQRDYTNDPMFCRPPVDR